MRSNVLFILVALFFYCCSIEITLGSGFLFKWEDVRVYGQPSYTANYGPYNTGTANTSFGGSPYCMSLRPSNDSTTAPTLWVGASVNSIARIVTFSTDFGTINSSFIVGVSVPQSPFPLVTHDLRNTGIQSILWIDSATCLVYSYSDGFVTTSQVLPGPNGTFNTNDHYGNVNGLGYSNISKQIFISLMDYNQVRVLANDGRTLLTIGNKDITTPPNASSLYGPALIHHDCAGGFWVADAQNCRILHFGWNQSIADQVVGQSNFTTSCPSSLFYNPQAIAMNDDCTTMWIGDIFTITIFRFRAPFNTSLPDGVLGSSNFSPITSPLPTSASTFYSILEMYYDSRTQRLYVLDSLNLRIIVGSTDEGTSDLKIIYQNVVIQTGETLQVNASATSQTLAIAGDLGLNNGSQTVLKQGQSVLVSQNIRFGGILTLIVNSTNSQRRTNEQLVSLFDYSSYDNSTFNEIKVDDGGSGCLTGEGQYSRKNMGVLISVNPACEASSKGSAGDGGTTAADGSTRDSIIIGVVVGVVGCCILLGIGIAVLVLIVFIVKKKVAESRSVAAKV